MRGVNGPYWILEESYWDPTRKLTRTRQLEYYGKEENIPPTVRNMYGVEKPSPEKESRHVEVVIEHQNPSNINDKIFAKSTDIAVNGSEIDFNAYGDMDDGLIPEPAVNEAGGTKEKDKEWLHDLFVRHYGEDYRSWDTWNNKGGKK